ncbi:rhomboid family intramembrane serine protease, partial [uncultured Maritalea sp.]|uniref:rhomboid family intramembrane serine protease n=1 Tax=uncultured Maritalea sp. TaxID=757249 RepID=UPI00261F3B1D
MDRIRHDVSPSGFMVVGGLPMHQSAVKESQMDHDHNTPINESPVNPMPPLIVAIFLVIMGIEAAFSMGSRGLVGGPEAVGWRIAAVQSYGFSGDVFDWMIENNRWPMEHVLRFVTYPFIHGSFTHAIFGGAMVLALGKMVGEAFSTLATLLIFVV